MTYKILIATPQPEFGELVRLNIEEGGDYDATAVKTGREVMELSNAIKYDLVVLDASITDKPFVPLAQNLIDENPTLKIIVIPPNNDSNDPALEEIMYHGLLSRPFYPPDLVEMVSDLLKSPADKKAVVEKPTFPEPPRSSLSENLDLESIANLLSEAANPPQISGVIDSEDPVDSATAAPKEEIIGPINEEDFAKEVEALFAQEGITKDLVEPPSEQAIPENPQLAEEPPVVVKESAPVAEIENPPAVSEGENLPISNEVETQAAVEENLPVSEEAAEPTEEETMALALKLAAQIRAQTESNQDNSGLVEEAEELLTEAQTPEITQEPVMVQEPTPVSNPVEPPAPVEPESKSVPSQPVSIKKEVVVEIEDAEANETYDELTQDDETLAKKHTDMAARFSELANQYLVLAKEHSDMAQHHEQIAEEKVRLTKEKAEMLAHKRELVSEIFQTQQSLKEIINQTDARGAIILKSGDMVAQVGKFSRAVFEEIGAVLLRYWDEDKRSDLIRFMRLQTDGSEQLLYASLIRDDFTLGLFYEPATSISLMRSQVTRLARFLSEQPLIDVLKLPVKDLEILSNEQKGEAKYEWVPESTGEDEKPEDQDPDNLSPDEVFRSVLSQLQSQFVDSSDQPMDKIDAILDSVLKTGKKTVEDNSEFNPGQALLSSFKNDQDIIGDESDIDSQAILNSVNNQLDNQMVASDLDLQDIESFEISNSINDQPDNQGLAPDLDQPDGNSLEILNSTNNQLDSQEVVSDLDQPDGDSLEILNSVNNQLNNQLVESDLDETDGDSLEILNSVNTPPASQVMESNLEKPGADSIEIPELVNFPLDGQTEDSSPVENDIDSLEILNSVNRQLDDQWVDSDMQESDADSFEISGSVVDQPVDSWVDKGVQESEVGSLETSDQVTNQLDNQWVESDENDLPSDFQKNPPANEEPDSSQNQAHSIFQDVLTHLKNQPTFVNDPFENLNLDNVLFPWDEPLQPMVNTTPLRTISEKEYLVSQTQPIIIKSQYRPKNYQYNAAHQTMPLNLNSALDPSQGFSGQMVETENLKIQESESVPESPKFHNIFNFLEKQESTKDLNNPDVSQIPEEVKSPEPQNIQNQGNPSIAEDQIAAETAAGNETISASQNQGETGLPDNAEKVNVLQYLPEIPGKVKKMEGQDINFIAEDLITPASSDETAAATGAQNVTNPGEKLEPDNTNKVQDIESPEISTPTGKQSFAENLAAAQDNMDHENTNPAENLVSAELPIHPEKLVESPASLEGDQAVTDQNIPPVVNKNGDEKSEIKGTGQKQPINQLLTYQFFSCVLIPRTADIQLTPDISSVLSEQMTEIAAVFGWRLINMDVKPNYMTWSIQVLPSVSVSSMVRLVRQRTSKRIFTLFSQFSKLIDSGDFWASEFLFTNNSNPPTQNDISDFIKQTRRR